MSFGQDRKLKARKSRGKTRKFYKIERHPLYEKIIQWIKVGWSSYKIMRELRAIYPDQKEMHVESTTIWEFINAHPELVSEKRRITPEALGEDDSTMALATRIMILLGARAKPKVTSRTFSRAELLEFRNGVDGLIKFCADVLVWKGKPVILQDYQIEMAKKMLKQKRCLMLSGRQIGKDFLCGCFVLWESVIHPNWLTIIVSAAQRQSDLLMNRILSFIASNQQLIDSVANSTQEELTFTNGARVVALPATGLIRGYTEVNRVIANEVRDMPDTTFSHVMPMIGISRGSLYLFSTPPPGKIGYMWQAWNNPMFKKGRMQVPTTMNEYFPQEEIDLARKTMPFTTFQIEYLGQWADVGPVYIPVEKVDAVSIDYDTYLPEKPEKDKAYAAGYDSARINDYAVIIVTSQDKDDFVKTEYIHEFTPGTSLDTQVDYMKYLNEHFNFRHIVSEYVGIGIAPTDRLIEYFGSTIVDKFQSTLDNNFAAFENVKAKIEQGKSKIQIPLTALKLRNQLCMLEYKTTPTGKLKIQAQEMDFADAFKMSCWAWRKKVLAYGTIVNM